jgi:hypothetical protein
VNPVVPNRGAGIVNPVVPNRGAAIVNPVNPVVVPGNRVPVVGVGRGLPIAGGAGMMCDANGRVRGRASSPYVMALARQGMQLVPCPVAARAESAADSTASASSSAPTPSWAIALIVVGSILIVVLIVLVLRLTQILKSL